MKRKFAKLKGVGKKTDEHAQQNNRRPFVFGFTTEQGSTVWREGSIPTGLDAEYLAIWERLCNLCNANAIEDVARLDKGRKALKARKQEGAS
jgi:hypothetical protein